MFKVGEIVVCVSKAPYNYGEFYNHKYNVWFKKDLVGPKTITVGNTYEIISHVDNLVFVKNDKGRVKSFRKDRFVNKICVRKFKIQEICSKLAKK